VLFRSLEVDIEQLIPSRLGTAIHDSFEKIQIQGFIQEQRYYAEIDGQKISGKFDFLEKLNKNQHKLSDLKTTSVWTYIYGSNIESTRLQLSIYRWIGSKNNLDIINKANIIYMFTDWSRSKAKNDSTYPQYRCIVKPIELLSLPATEKYIKERLYMIKSNFAFDCTPEELWQGKDCWKVYKNDNKGASKVCDTKEQADDYVLFAGIANSKKGTPATYRIEEVKGKVNRCNYCLVTEHCNQYRLLKEQDLIKEE
jgi:hypothetical protein